MRDDYGRHPVDPLRAIPVVDSFLLAGRNVDRSLLSSS